MRKTGLFIVGLLVGVSAGLGATTLVTQMASAKAAGAEDDGHEFRIAEHFRTMCCQALAWALIAGDVAHRAVVGVIGHVVVYLDRETAGATGRCRCPAPPVCRRRLQAESPAVRAR